MAKPQKNAAHAAAAANSQLDCGGGSASAPPKWQWQWHEAGGCGRPHKKAANEAAVARAALQLRMKAERAKLSAQVKEIT